MTEVSATPEKYAMSPRDRRRVIVGIVVLVALLMIGGAVTAWFNRHDTICKDGRPPLQQHDVALGQVQYRCHDGELVTK